MTHYVCGFMTNEAGFTLLIRKNRPQFQAGKLNGVGGKLEPGEWPHDAMVREFFEETGLHTTTGDWKLKIHLVGPDFELNFFTARSEFTEAYSKTDEPLVAVDSRNMPFDECLSNMKWVFPLAHDPVLMFPILLKDRRANGTPR